nr:MAG TPA: hypothetical protein [Ackermannviridae sp.]
MTGLSLIKLNFLLFDWNECNMDAAFSEPERI